MSLSLFHYYAQSLTHANTKYTEL